MLGLLLVTGRAAIAVALLPIFLAIASAAASAPTPAPSAIMFASFGVLALAFAVIFRPLFALTIVGLTVRPGRGIVACDSVVGRHEVFARWLAAVVVDRNLLVSALLTVVATIAPAASAPSAPAARFAAFAVIAFGGCWRRFRLGGLFFLNLVDDALVFKIVLFFERGGGGLGLMLLGNLPRLLGRMHLLTAIDDKSLQCWRPSRRRLP